MPPIPGNTVNDPAVTDSDLPDVQSNPMGIVDLSTPVEFQADFIIGGSHHEDGPARTNDGLVPDVSLFAKVHRGNLQQIRAAGELDVRYGLRFMFNPSDFQWTYTISNDSIPLDQLDPTAFDTAFAPTGRTFSLTLAFDRTLEMLSNHRRGSAINRPFEEIGVMEDIRQLEKVLGIVEIGAPLPYTPLMYVPNADEPVDPERSGGAFDIPIVGIPTAVSVGITHFSYKMVPMRAVVNMNFTQLFIRPANLFYTNLGGFDPTGTIVNDTGFPTEPPTTQRPPVQPGSAARPVGAGTGVF